jgi:hypothetical protein
LSVSRRTSHETSNALRDALAEIKRLQVNADLHHKTSRRAAITLRDAVRQLRSAGKGSRMRRPDSNGLYFESSCQAVCKEGTQAMADEVQQQPPLIDPGNITETICDGPVNISVRGPLATLTFTHVRPDDTGLPKDGAMELKSVVRARIVLTGNNLVALRDLLIRAIKEQGGDERRH